MAEGEEPVAVSVCDRSEKPGPDVPRDELHPHHGARHQPVLGLRLRLCSGAEPAGGRHDLEPALSHDVRQAAKSPRR